MNSHDREKLLKEILPSDDVADFRRASLESGLAGMHRERQRRHIMRTGAMAAILICLFVGIFLKSRNTTRNQDTKIQPLPTAAWPALASHVDFISDDQLLALFTNQPVALIGKPGEQRLVFLSQPREDFSQ